MTRSAPTSWRPNPEVLARRLDEEMVLVHLGTAEVFTLNRTAARLWELIGEGLGSADLGARLSVEFDVAPDDLAGEVDRLVADLVEHRLVIAE